MSRLCLVVALSVGATASANAAIYLSESGTKATLAGEVDLGDEDKFAAFLAQPRARKLTTLYLDSNGGSVKASVAIGRMIRKAGLTTAVRADRAWCDSACTMLFSAGRKRHYVNSERIIEGFSARGGLGYHPAHNPGGGLSPGQYSDRGTKIMEAYFREMGTPQASALAHRAGFNSTFRPSGRTALALKIATSLAPPAD